MERVDLPRGKFDSHRAITEQSETLARCAALSRFGVSDVEIASGEVWSPGSSIYPDEDFDVSPVL
jgi:hypothetical protein